MCGCCLRAVCILWVDVDVDSYCVLVYLGAVIVVIVGVVKSGNYGCCQEW